MLPIAIDVMSGDHEPREYVAGALRALADDRELRAAAGRRRRGCSRRRWRRCRAAMRARAEVVPASQVVAMGDKPREAIRRKKDSSMRVAIDLVQAGRACAAASAPATPVR